MKPGFDNLAAGREVMHEVCFELEARLTVDEIVASNRTKEAVDRARAAVRDAVMSRKAALVSAIAAASASDELLVLDTAINKAVTAFMVSNLQKRSGVRPCY